VEGKALRAALSWAVRHRRTEGGPFQVANESLPAQAASGDVISGPGRRGAGTAAAGPVPRCPAGRAQAGGYGSRHGCDRPLRALVMPARTVAPPGWSGRLGSGARVDDKPPGPVTRTAGPPGPGAGPGGALASSPWWCRGGFAWKGMLCAPPSAGQCAAAGPAGARFKFTQAGKSRLPTNLTH
jgi:hypothetical protein